MMSTSDLIGLIGLIVAINALVTAVFLWAIDKDRRRTKRNVELLRRHIKFTSSFIDSLVEYVINLDKLTATERGRLNELIKTSKGEDYLNKYRNSTKLIRLDISRSRQELMLHTKNINAKESAYKQLANAFGDISSYDLISTLQLLNKKDQKEHHHYKAALKERLINDNRSTIP